MSNLHKKSAKKQGKPTTGLTEERVREIAREEVIKYLKEQVKAKPPITAY